jgi:hypothetical protein
MIFSLFETRTLGQELAHLARNAACLRFSLAMKRILPFLLLLTATFSHAGEPLLTDDFSPAENPARKALRGAWSIADGAATCAQDDELYKKHKNHGPILIYDLKYEDAVIEFAFKPDAATKSLVFTANGEDGHIFRIVIGAKNASIRAFPADAKDHASIALATLPELKLVPGEWTPVRVELRGPHASVKVGNFTGSYEHASLTRAKTNLTVGFSFGTLSVKSLAAIKP